MKPNLIDFPKRYETASDPAGEKWLAAYSKATAAAEAGGIVALIGGRGTGKSRMAYEIAKHADLPRATRKIGPNAFEPLPAIYRTAMELFVELRASYHPKADWSEFDLLRWYRNAALLVIDEVQESAETNFENQKLTAVIDSRYQDGRPTILIANLTTDQLAKSISDSVISRIQESGGIVPCNWPSYRKPKP